MKIALLGYGIVGSGVYERLEQNKTRFKNEYERDVEVVAILVNRLEKYEHLDHFSLFTNSFDEILKMDFDVLIETIGGIEPAFTYVNTALKRQVSVITSNKDLIAEKGAVLYQTSLENNVQLSYEASVAGGIPILKPIRECLGGDQINEIVGIINGTTNFILTKMNVEGLSYSDALSMAQNLGFAEADPTSDVEGLDAVRKISILTKLGLKIDMDWKKIPVEGITKISPADVDYFKNTNQVVKLLGISKLSELGVYTSVRPVVLSKQSKFACINNEFNAISVTGEAVGELFFSGKGAGKNPTATSILADLVDLMQNKKMKINVPYKDVNVLPYYPDRADWILRLSPLHRDVIQKKAVQLLDSDTFAFTTPSEDSSMYLRLSGLTENELISFKENIDQLEAKHYLVLS